MIFKYYIFSFKKNNKKDIKSINKKFFNLIKKI